MKKNETGFTDEAFGTVCQKCLVKAIAIASDRTRQTTAASVFGKRRGKQVNKLISDERVAK